MGVLHESGQSQGRHTRHRRHRPLATDNNDTGETNLDSVPAPTGTNSTSASHAPTPPTDQDLKHHKSSYKPLSCLINLRQTSASIRASNRIRHSKYELRQHIRIVGAFFHTIMASDARNAHRPRYRQIPVLSSTDRCRSWCASVKTDDISDNTTTIIIIIHVRVIIWLKFIKSKSIIKHIASSLKLL